MKNPTWSDAELIDYEFNVVGRPDLDPELTTERPANGAKLTFLRAYNVTPPKDLPNREKLQPRVWCALCQEPTHWIGWETDVKEESRSRRVLVGQHCAKRSGGDVIKLAANDFKARQDRGEALRARRAVLAIYPQVRQALAQWQSSTGIRALGQWRETLDKLAPRLCYDITMSAQVSPAALLVERRVRDRAAEEIRAKRRGELSSEMPIYKTEYQNVGVLPCRSLYFGVRAEDQITNIIMGLDRAVAQLGGTTDGDNGMTTRVLKVALSEVRGRADRCRMLERDFAKAPAAVEPQAVDQIVSWHNEIQKAADREGRLSRQGAHLFAKGYELDSYEVERKPIIVTIPALEAPIRPPELDLLEEALLGKDPI